MTEHLTTRPRLATALMEAGIEGRPTLNPFDPQKRAWLFPVSPEMIRITRAFYDSIGKPLPMDLREEAGR